MTTIITSISLSMEDSKFLEDNPELSASKLLRSKIFEVRENRSDLKVQLIRSHNTIKFLNEKLQELNKKNDLLEANK